MKVSRNYKTFLACLTLLVLEACGSKGSDTLEEKTQQAIEENGLSAAYPSSLAISIFPKEEDDASGLIGLQADEEDKKLPKEQIEERKKRLAGDADCFPTGLFDDRRAEAVTCYEFDNDMNPFIGGPAGSGGTSDGKHSDGEACLVAFARQEVLDATQYVDRALDGVAGMLCAVKKAGGDTSLPADGETKDFLDQLGEDEKLLGISRAKMTNLGDGLYRTSLVVDGDKGRFAMNLVYKPGAGEDEGSGIISYKKAPRPARLQQDPNNSDNMVQYVSVRFSQELNDEDQLASRFEVRIASIEKSLDGFDEMGIVNYDVIPDNAQDNDPENNQANQISNNFKFLQFDLVNDTAEGNISYWRNPGGGKEEPARGFVFNIESGESGLAGCGASGAANSSIRDELATGGNGSAALKPVRFMHPFGNENTAENQDDRYMNGEDRQGGPKITVQCFAQNETSGLYEIDYEKTKSISSETDDAEVDERGYDVIPQAAGNERIKPPPAPRKVPEGEFKDFD